MPGTVANIFFSPQRAQSSQRKDGGFFVPKGVEACLKQYSLIGLMLANA